MADGPQSTVVIERSAVQRDGLDVKVLWRERGSFPVLANRLAEPGNNSLR
jgi:hypothetical protein